MRRYVAAAAVLAILPVMPAADKPCEKLLKESYWRKARLEQVVRCLEEGLDPNTKVKVAKRLYYPLLQVAIADSSPEVVEALIAAGADIGYRDSSGKSLLNYAVTILRVSKVEILLDAGVEFDDRNPMPFSFPAETIKLLLDAGWDPNRRWPWDGETTLYNAARFGEPEVVRLLLDYGADPTIPDHKGRTPFSRSKGENRRILAKALGIDIEKTKTKSGLGALAAGVVGATVGNAAGLDEQEALALGQDLATTVHTGQPTNSAMMQVVRQREAEQRLAQQIAAQNAALVDALKDELAAQQQGEDAAASQAAQRRRQAEKAMQALEDKRNRMAEQARQATKVLNSNCECIRIEEDGDYVCLDGFVVGNNSSGGRPCDIDRR